MVLSAGRMSIVFNTIEFEKVARFDWPSTKMDLSRGMAEPNPS